MKNILNQEENRGFSLVEVMFVIILLGVLALSGIKYLQSRQKSQLIEKTAIEMGNLLQAGMIYFSINEQWPAKIEQLLASNDDLLDGMLPPDAKCSPYAIFNSPYNDPECGDHPAYQVKPSNPGDLIGSKYFEVSVMVPTEEIAKAIAARLPNSTINANIVYGAVSVVGSGDPDPHSLLIKTVSMQYIDEKGMSVNKPNCPLKWTPKLSAGFAMIFNQQGSSRGWQNVVLEDDDVYPMKYIWLGGKECPTKEAKKNDYILDNDDKYVVDRLNTFTSTWKIYPCVYPELKESKNLFWDKNKGRIDGRGTAIVITYCEPPGYNPATPY